MCGSGQAQRQNERYIMTGHTGSFLYMAPEVVRCEPYNEKVRFTSPCLCLKNAELLDIIFRDIIENNPSFFPLCR